MTIEQADEIYGVDNSHSPVECLLYLILRALKPKSTKKVTLSFEYIDGTGLFLNIAVIDIAGVVEISLHKASLDASSDVLTAVLGEIDFTNVANMQLTGQDGGFNTGAFYRVSLLDQNNERVYSDYVLYNITP